MRVIVDPSTFDCLNMGDVAMLQSTVGRLFKQFPNAEIQIFTNDASAVSRHCPGSQPLAHRGRTSWFSDRDLLGRLHRYLPERTSRALARLKRDVRRRTPGLLETAMLGKMGLTGADNRPLRSFITALDQVDIYVVSGAATLNDKARAHARVVLATIEIALKRGVPVAMFSQGIGPISDPVLFAEAERILPRVGLIALRENLYGPALLKSLGVSPEKVFVTGDDSIEMAYNNRGHVGREGIGVNFRVASSSDISASLIEVVRGVLHRVAMKHHAPLIPLPIALHAAANDQLITKQLITGTSNETENERIPDGPYDVIKACGQCRIVVTGAYHAAVFALAQGIPAICLFGNVNYTQKFMGLANQFGAGCELLSVNVSHFADSLEEAIEQAWIRAPAQRMPLLTAAARQTEQSDAAYSRLGQLITSSPSPLGAAA
ncbi:MAG TPA: polysaccharide pyruvyl transferase family protein [Pyrinomonadaceae bacterium]|nr:polysaccharide pyruvyl transferase family protein [Pyrinomonadaceae bacterium]